MYIEYKGKVLIHSIPTLQAAQQVYKALRTVYPEAGKDALLAMMRQRPVLLLDAVPQQDVAEVLEFFKSFGVSATFVVEKPQRTAPPLERNRLRNPEGEPPAPEAAAKRKATKSRGWWGRQCLAFGVIICGALFAFWMFNPVLATSLLPFLPAYPQGPLAVFGFSRSGLPQAPGREVPSRFQEPYEAPLKASPLPELLPVRQSVPGLLQVPPGQMYDAFLLRYRLQPDVRFARALGFLAAMERDKEKRLAPGEMLWSSDELIIPLLKKGKKIDVLHTALPLTFARMLEALENWMQLLEKHGYSFALSDAPVLQLPYTSAIAAISQVDQRRILNGLAALDQLWRTGGPNRNLLEAAIRGYVLLQVTMRPDPLQRSDTLAGDSLGMLALARHGRPAAAAGVAFMVARLMGYGRYASALTLPEASKRVFSDESLLLAYFQKDRSALQKMNGQDPSTLSRYLLARLLTDSGDTLPAYELYKRIGREHPYGFPWLSESFYVNTLNASKQTTLTYPLLILNQIVPPAENSPAKKALMDRYSQAVLGGPSNTATDGQKDVSSEADISFEAFEKLLAQWRPFTDAEASGVFMDNGKAQLVMRTLYEGAMEQRFKLLFINWNVIDAAYAFSSSLLGKDKQHRLAKHYLAQALIGKGNSSDAARYAAEIFNDGRTSGQFAYDVYSTLQQLRKTAGLASGMARKLDSRPAFQGLLGNVFFSENNPHMAAAFYEKAAKGGDKQLWLLKNIQKITKSDTPLLEYAAAHPDDCEIQSAVGKYFTDKKTTQGFAEAFKYYTRAVELRPDDAYLQMLKAWCLRKTGRYDASAAILKDAISLYPRRDLTYTQLLTCLAKNYLERGDAALAVETIKDQIASYKNDTLVTGARAYEQAGDLAKAEEIYRQSAERYPASAYSLSHLAQFYWKQGKFAQAAGVVKKGRSSGAMRYDWYFEAFIEVFTELPPEKGLEAYKAFADARGPAWEVERLAEKLADNGLHQLAYEIAGLQMPVNPHAVATRCILLNTIGRTLQNPPDTIGALRNLIKADYRKDRLQNMLLGKGKYALAYDIYKDAAAFDNNVRHAIMLNNLVCWLRLDKQPPAAEQEFVAFFNQQRDSYLMLPGRFLLGLASREAFLASADTVSKRALACYYIGLQERLRGKFNEAAIWYQMCRETMGRVYQTGWAIAELHHWFDVGTSNLAKLDKADVLRESAEL